jgi:hypothetical protein
MRNGKRGRYTVEFKLEAVRLVESGQSIGEAARSLGVVEQTLSNVQCRVLRVSVSGFHQHLARRKVQRHHMSDAALLAHISAVYAEHRGA